MEPTKQLSKCHARCERGFTITEVIMVLAILVILSVLAVPSYQQWVQNAEYRGSARNIVFILREARSKAIATNLEHRVEFESDNRRYRVTRGNRSNNSIDWNTVVRDWVSLPADVRMRVNVDAIQLNTNGTANGGTIRIQDATATTRYEVRIARTGRVRIPTIF